MRSSSRILTVACFMCAMVGCVTVPVERELPPAALLLPCHEPESQINTNGELAQWALALRQALRTCNNQLDSLREWANTE